MASDNHASYTRIGLTVVIGVVAIVGSLIYLGGMRGRDSEILVETYYDKPVTGLSVGSVVNFRGVKVGEVRDISFVGNVYNVQDVAASRIYILMALDGRLVAPAIPEDEIAKRLGLLVEKAGLRATVASSGITGLSRIELNYNSPENLDPVQPISWTPKHVYIPEKISLFDNITVAATTMLNEINQMDIGAAWSNLSAAVEALARATEGAKNLLETRQGDIDLMVDDLAETSAAARDLVEELKRNPSLLIRERKPRRLEETE